MKRVCLLFLFFICKMSSAACELNDYAAEHVSSVPAIVVQRDVPVGTVLQTIKTNPTGTANVVVCRRTGYLYYAMKYSSASPMTGIYETNVPGVGIKVESPGGRVFESPANKVDYSGQSGFSDTAPYTITFYKTGNIVSGKVAPGLAAEIYGDDSQPGLDIFLDSETSVTQLACSVTTSGMNFSLGDIAVSEFTAPGTVSKKTAVDNLRLNCDPGANINVTLEGNQNPDMPSDTSVLELSAGGTAASGIGVQFLYNGTPLKLNTLLPLKTSAGGDELFPVTARYIQTKSTISAGAANAVATLNISYQ